MCMVPGQNLKSELVYRVKSMHNIHEADGGTLQKLNRTLSENAVNNLGLVLLYYVSYRCYF